MWEFGRLLIAVLLASAPVAAEAQAAADAIVAIAQTPDGGAFDVTMTLDRAMLEALIDGARWAASSLVAYAVGRSQPVPSWRWMQPARKDEDAGQS